MDEIFIILIVLAVGCILSGPVAFIISIIALNRTKDIFWQIQNFWRLQNKVPPAEPKAVVPESHKENKFKELAKPERPAPRPPLPIKQPVDVKIEKPPVKTTPTFEKRKEPSGVDEAGTLEQLIGTRWILVAGVITVFVGIGFFLKYAYDNFSISPMTRVMVVVVFGFAALLAGEVTRRKGYDIVAKGVTALGFAVLYAAVFAAYQIYGLIGYIPACAFAIFVTIAAMIYAVVLDEKLIAFLSLFGGFLTPLIVLSKLTSPNPLFVYVLILGAGAMFCAYYRRWRAVNSLSFIGTFAIYTIWFYGSKYSAVLCSGKALSLNQISFVLGWLGVFFVVYLVVPILYELVNRVKSDEEDSLLILANAAAVLFYMCVVLFDSHRNTLAFAVVILALIHFAFSAIVHRRCKEDINLQMILQAIGIFFITLAAPFYFKLNATTISWACEAVVLILIGLRYASYLIQAGGIVVMLLSAVCLLVNMPMHTCKFNFILNPEFGKWCFVSIAIYLCHLLYRQSKSQQRQDYALLSQIIYGLSVLLLFAAASMECYYNYKYNMAVKNQAVLIREMMVIFVLAVQLFVIRPIAPAGIIPKTAATSLAVIGAMFAVGNFPLLHNSGFTIFWNIDFAAALLFTAGLFFAAWLTSRTDEQGYDSRIFTTVFSLIAVLTMWIILSQEIYRYWYCRDKFTEPVHNWKFLAQMYISIMWAIYGAILMIVGFWRKIRPLRYISIGLFAILLMKVFLIDTQEIKNIYRVMAFMVTGITLVGISYLYQHLKKKGFFESLFTDKTPSSR